MGVRLKRKITNLYDRFRFYLSSTNSIFILLVYRYFFRPAPGSIDYVIDMLSKESPGDFTVVQIGANDGLINDPIHKFIKRDNWSGVLLEPQKYVFTNYLSRVYSRNKNIVCLNAAIGEKDGNTSLYKIAFSNERWAHGLSSFRRDVLEKSLSSGYAKRKARKEKVTIPQEAENQIAEERVEVISAPSLLTRFDIREIDLLQIDAEGYDYEVIKMFDIGRTRPALISFESLHFSKEEYSSCIEYLNTRGYSCRTIGANTIAMHKPGEKYIHLFNDEKPKT